jgi:hypothetical protein
LIATKSGFADAVGALVAAGAVGGFVAAGGFVASGGFVAAGTSVVGVPPQAVRMKLATIRNDINSENFFIVSPPRDNICGSCRLTFNQVYRR